MIMILPDWYMKAQKKLDDCIDDILRKNEIDWVFAHDSAAINEAKGTILMSLVRIYEKVGIEERKMMDDFKKQEEKDGKRSINKNKS